MYWLKDARETLDVLLTYGDVDDPLFAHMLEEYRAVARAHGRSTEFEHLVAEMMLSSIRFTQERLYQGIELDLALQIE